jgi:hypothetical protein
MTGSAKQSRPRQGRLDCFVAYSPHNDATSLIISDDIGGKVQEYTTHFRQVRGSASPVVIAGTCVSACTLVLGLVPSDRICATRNAVLGFHAASMFDNSGKRVVSASGTQDLLQTYPAPVRAWIVRRFYTAKYTAKTQRGHSPLRHPGHTHALTNALASSEICRIVV